MNTEEYLLVCLMEECQEVSQRISKALRFGLEEVQKSNANETRTNRERINYELQDLQAVVGMLIEQNDAYQNSVDSFKARQLKREKLLRYMEYSKEQGKLND